MAADGSLFGKLQETISRVHNCLSSVQNCCRLCSKLEDLRDLESKNETTKMILMLSKYGSKNEFLEACKSAFDDAKKSFQSFSGIVTELERIREEKTCKCPSCNGIGSFSKTEYLRERGTVEPVLRSLPCTECNGQGKLHLSQKSVDYLSMFLEILRGLLLFLENLLTDVNKRLVSI
jgi:hypothetical protein